MLDVFWFGQDLHLLPSITPVPESPPQPSSSSFPKENKEQSELKQMKVGSQFRDCVYVFPPFLGGSQGDSKGAILERRAEVVAEEAVDEGVNSTVQGWQVLNNHGCVEALFGLREYVEVVQDIKKKVRAPTENKCWKRDRGRKSLALDSLAI